MKRALLLVSLVAACTDTEPDFVRVGAIAGEHHVVGVDTDGAGGLWLAYQMSSQSYFYDDLRIVHLDPAGTKLAVFRYTETDLRARGLAVAPDALYIAHSAGLDDPKNRVRKLDPATGAELAVFPGEPGIVDLEIRGDTLLASSIWRELIAMDATSGAPLWRSSLPDLDGSWSGGIASTPAGTWVVDITEWRVLLVDDTGATLRTASVEQDHADWWMQDDQQLAWDGKHLVINRGNQIIWYQER